MQKGQSVYTSGDALTIRTGSHIHKWPWNFYPLIQVFLSHKMIYKYKFKYIYSFGWKHFTRFISKLSKNFIIDLGDVLKIWICLVMMMEIVCFSILIVASRSSFIFLETRCHDSKMLHVFIIWLFKYILTNYGYCYCRFVKNHVVVRCALSET